MGPVGPRALLCGGVLASLAEEETSGRLQTQHTKSIKCGLEWAAWLRRKRGGEGEEEEWAESRGWSGVRECQVEKGGGRRERKEMWA